MFTQEMWTHTVLRLLLVFAVMGALTGCSLKYVQPPEAYYGPGEEQPATQRYSVEDSSKRLPQDTSYKVCAISEHELSRIAEIHPDLTYDVLIEIPARLNRQARYYVRDNIKNGNPIRVPDSFVGYKILDTIAPIPPGSVRHSKVDPRFQGYFFQSALEEPTTLSPYRKGE